MIGIRLLALLAPLLAFQAPQSPQALAPVPTPENFAHWREHIRPDEPELAFEGCEWKPTFWEAVVEAQARGKPILLWAMNGHPLACT